MTRQITLELDESVLLGAEWLAERGKVPVTEVLEGVIRQSIPDIRPEFQRTRRVEDLSDQELTLRMSEKMAEHRDSRLSDLLQAQQARDLSAGERDELQELMREYQILLLRTSEAVAEAGHRGMPLPKPTAYSR